MQIFLEIVLKVIPLGQMCLKVAHEDNSGCISGYTMDDNVNIISRVRYSSGLSPKQMLRLHTCGGYLFLPVSDLSTSNPE